MAAAPWIVSDELWELIEAAVAEAAAIPPRRAQAPRRPADAVGNPVRPPHGDRVAASAWGARLRLRGHLLAPS